MKRIGVWMVLLGLLVAAMPALAADAQYVTSSGQVVSVDAKANAVMVKVENSPGETRDVSFTVGKDTKIIKSGEEIGISGLTAGDKVTITFQTVNGKNMAVNVGVEAKPAA